MSTSRFLSLCLTTICIILAVKARTEAWPDQNTFNVHSNHIDGPISNLNAVGKLSHGNAALKNQKLGQGRFLQSIILRNNLDGYSNKGKSLSLVEPVRINFGGKRFIFKRKAIEKKTEVAPVAEIEEEEPMIQQTQIEEPILEEPVMEEPVFEEPEEEEPVFEEPEMEEPVIEEPEMEEPRIEETVFEELEKEEEPVEQEEVVEDSGYLDNVQSAPVPLEKSVIPEIPKKPPVQIPREQRRPPQQNQQPRSRLPPQNQQPRSKLPPQNQQPRSKLPPQNQQVGSKTPKYKLVPDPRVHPSSFPQTPRPTTRNSRRPRRPSDHLRQPSRRQSQVQRATQVSRN